MGVHVSASMIPHQATAVHTGGFACGDAGLTGATIAIGGLRVTIMDALVRIAFADGTSVTRILRPQTPSFVVGEAAEGRVDGWGYFRLGVDHILSGIDHLLFVFGVLWIVAGLRRLLKAITTFTVAHSITLGFVRVPPAPVKALVALSIVFLAVEIAQRDRGAPSLTYRRPWVVAFASGLLHGFGFACTLSQIGIPPGDIPLALLSFNLGVEAGQIGFIAAALALFCRAAHPPALDDGRRAPGDALGLGGRSGGRPRRVMAGRGPTVWPADRRRLDGHQRYPTEGAGGGVR